MNGKRSIDSQPERPAKRQRMENDKSGSPSSASTQVTKPVTKIVDTGDVIFILNDGKTRLLVKSSAMMLASPAFAAMFGEGLLGGFREGTNLSEDHPKEVPLPDDHPQAMKVICEVVHHRYDMERHYPSFELLEEIAILVDKYFLQRSMRATCTQWLLNCTQKAREAQYKEKSQQNLLGLAYLLDNAKMFNSISKDLIVFYPGSFSKLGDFQERLPWRILLKLGEQRQLAKEEMMRTAASHMSSWLGTQTTMIPACTRPVARVRTLSGAIQYDCLHKITKNFNLDKSLIQGPPEASVISLWDYWRPCDRPEPHSRKGAPTFRKDWPGWVAKSRVCYGCLEDSLDWLDEEVLEELADDLTKKLMEIKGLCLDCGGKKDVDCRIDHGAKVTRNIYEN